jgi:hypothetical protein
MSIPIQPTVVCRPAELDPTSVLVQHLGSKCLVRRARSIGPAAVDLAIKTRAETMVRLVRSCRVVDLDQSLRTVTVKPRWRRRSVMIPLEHIVAAWMY